tara:strand:- start:591 stop:740 length:150 start_codon:yes stop_codon:yes gene_type:complete
MMLQYIITDGNIVIKTKAKSLEEAKLEMSELHPYNNWVIQIKRKKEIEA